MAIRILNEYDTKMFSTDDNKIQAGHILALNKFSGNVARADRTIHGTNWVVGISVENTITDECYRININPIGSTYINSNFNANVNFYRSIERKISPNLTNTLLKDILILQMNSQISFCTDMFEFKQLKNKYEDDENEIEIKSGDILTYGTNENAGKFVVIPNNHEHCFLNVAKVLVCDRKEHLITLTLLKHQYIGQIKPCNECLYNDRIQIKTNILDNLIIVEDLF